MGEKYPRFRPFYFKFHKERLAMKKNVFAILRKGTAFAAALLCIGCMAAPVWADKDSDEEVEIYTSGDYTYSLMLSVENQNKKAACIESYTGSETTLVLPETIDGLPVVALGDNAFVQSHMLEEVTLPRQMVGIGMATFADCSALKNYYVAEGNPYFESIDGVLYAEDGTYLVRYPIGRDPVDVVVPDGVYDIGYVAFAYSRSLTTIQLPDSLEQIGAWAFADCPQLNHVKIPESVTQLEDFLFFRCFGLEDITLPDTIKSIGDSTFASTGLKEFTIPSGCTTIGQATFANTEMTEITVPKTVTSIDFSAFGWKLDRTEQLYADESFVIRGYKGTVAEQYATDTENGNVFTFIALDEETKQTDTNSKNPSHTVTTTAKNAATAFLAELTPLRIAGLVISVLALIAVIIGGAIWMKKK